ncbi:MAG TPA: site-2 protease family protein [Terriglobia bacterium]|nr:site-2 protease family protein [Terriglobia bacterium]
MNILGAVAAAGVGSSCIFLLTIVTAMVHEAGHAIAWTLAGARVREVGFARPHGPALRVKIGKLTIAFNPFTVFAYTLIEGSNEQLTPSRSQRLLLHGAGIGANLLAAALGLAFNDPMVHLFAVSSAVLAFQNMFFKDGERMLAALSNS